VSNGRELGVDIERVRPLNDMHSIARNSFSAAESQDLFSLPSELQTGAFFKCWTRKEAFIKATGEGLSYALDQVQVTVHPYTRAEFVSIRGFPARQNQWTLYDISPDPDAAAALAVEVRNCFVRKWFFDNAGECARLFD
jgi:4'-phosphopantetheinyl transferase